MSSSKPDHERSDTESRVALEYPKSKTDLAADLESELTIASVEEEDVAKRHSPVNLKHVVHFEESSKSLVLGWVVAEQIGKVLGSLDMDDWIGKKITLFLDPTVTYNGERVGGIRIRPVSPERGDAHEQT